MNNMMNAINKGIWLFLLLSLPLLAQAQAQPTPPLAGYEAVADQTSVSGISSGGFMASQFHVAYSNDLIGAGIVAGGPYFCASSNRWNPFSSYLTTAASTCMNPCQWVFAAFRSYCEAVALPDGEALAEAAAEQATAGQIDPVANLADDRIYLFSGGLDETVVTGVVSQTLSFYQAMGVPKAAIKFDQISDAQHAYISDNTDRRCDADGAPFINNCDGYDQARLILEHIYGPLNPNVSQLSGTMIEFDQTAFVPAEDLKRSALADTAYAYVPKSCGEQACRIHVAFHGCKQSAAEYSSNKVYFRDLAGYNEVADSNQLIILYPQIRSRQELQISPYNPRGCWDFWGYSGDDFYTRQAIQMSAVRAMIDRLAQPQ